MKNLALILAAITIAGCSTTPNKDRREWIEVTCSGFADWSHCYQKAKNICPNGYNMANREENLVTQKRSVLISCK
jgi:hypothetical protein